MLHETRSESFQIAIDALLVVSLNNLGLLQPVSSSDVCERVCIHLPVLTRMPYLHLQDSFPTFSLQCTLLCVIHCVFLVSCFLTARSDED